MLKEDARMLYEHNLMDYSLLFYIEKVPDARSVCEKKDPRQKRHSFPSHCNQYIYHIGIIDYLQNYGLIKKGESCLKTAKSCSCCKSKKNKKPSKISCVKPLDYAKRFLHFMEEEVVGEAAP